MKIHKALIKLYKWTPETIEQLTITEIVFYLNYVHAKEEEIKEVILGGNDPVDDAYQALSPKEKLELAEILHPDSININYGYPKD